MRKFSVIFLILSAGAGAAGFFLRRLELATAFEPATGLMLRSAPAAQLIVAATVLILLAAAAVAAYISTRYIKPKNHETAFGTGFLIYPFILIPVSTLWAYGTVMYFLDLRASWTIQTLDIYFLVLSAMSAISTVIITIETFQSTKSKSPYILIIVPIVFLCFWLILLYRQNAANPVMQDYIYACMAIISSILGFYYSTGFLYGKSYPARAFMSYFASIYFCSVAIADGLSTGLTLIYSALLTSGAAHMFLLMRNLERKRPEAKDASQTSDPTEANEDENE